MRLLSTFLLYIAVTASYVIADTEIRNFNYPLTVEGSAVQPATTLSRLTVAQRQIELGVSSTEPDKWIELDLEDDTSTSWTVRLSWPGSTPTKFEMNLHPSVRKDETRTLLLHIQASALSPRTPSSPLNPFQSILNIFHLTPSPAPPAPETDLSNLNNLLKIVHGETALPSPQEFETRFHLVLEPLIFGILPKTAVPTLGLIAVFGGVAAMLAPRAVRFIERRRGETIAALEQKDKNL